MSPVSLLVVIACVRQVLSAGQTNRIVGGHNTKINDYPHQISLRSRPIFCPQCPYSHYCGGSILAKNIVLTAAHCVDGRESKTFAVVSGSNNLNGGDGFIVKVKNIYIHDSYDIWTIDNDVAVLHLAQDLPSNYLSSPIKLADELPEVDELATVTGWGETVLDGNYSDMLRYVQVPILDSNDCQNSYKYEVVTPNMVCAGVKQGGKDMCRGDSGGPLIYKDKQIGIVSWGYECGSPSYPGVYTSVPSVKDWIYKTVNEVNKIST